MCFVSDLTHGAAKQHALHSNMRAQTLFLIRMHIDFWMMLLMMLDMQRVQRRAAQKATTRRTGSGQAYSAAGKCIFDSTERGSYAKSTIRYVNKWPRITNWCTNKLRAHKSDTLFIDECMSTPLIPGHVCTVLPNFGESKAAVAFWQCCR